VVLAAFASAGAIALPLIGQHGLPAYAAGGLGVALGLAAVTLSALARGRLLGLAGTCVLLAAASVLLARNDVVSQKEAEETLKQAQALKAAADEAPARAEAALKKAEEAEARAEEAPRKAAMLLEQVKAEQAKLDRKRDQLAAEKADLAAERGKIEEEKGKVEEQRKQAEASKQAAADLAKKAEGDKLRAKETLEKAEQKEKDAQDKAQEAKELLKKVEETLKAAALQLKDKNPAVRFKTANAIAKLPQLPEAKEILGEPLVEAMLDPTPGVRHFASEALSRIDPAIHPHVLTLLIGQDKRGAGKKLEGLGEEARNALPALIFSYRSNAGRGSVTADQLPQIRAIWLDTLVRSAPNDKRVVDIVLAEVANNKDRFHFAREKAISLLNSVGADNKDKVKALMTVFDAHVLSVTAIMAVERIGAPDAEAAIPALKRLKSSSNDAVRSAATKALSVIEKAK
jgi:hypothetical protein